jgi:myo-inositol-1(or 4)-monophosphatase
VDLGFAVDGRFGGCINNSTKIWDIASALLMFEEAGGKITDMNGSKIEFTLDENIKKKEFHILGSSKTLQPKLLKLIEKSASTE